VLDHLVRDAAEQKRLHSAEAAGAEHDDDGVDLGGDLEDRSRSWCDRVPRASPAAGAT